MSDEIKKRILIVDDEPGFTELVKFNLEATGQYQVLVENNSSVAVQAALDYLPDLILLDVIMPEPEGPDVLFQLRNHDRLKKIPVIFLTATVRRAEAEDQEAGETGYVFLAKPSTVQELIRCIESQLQRE